LRPLPADEQEHSSKARLPRSGLPSAITVETKLNTDFGTNVARTAIVAVLGRAHRTAAIIPRRADRPGRWTITRLLIAPVMVMTVPAVAVATITVPAVAVPAVAAITAMIIVSFSRCRESRNGEDCNDNREHSFHDSRWI
jgi:hypothetical protein